MVDTSFFLEALQSQLAEPMVINSVDVRGLKRTRDVLILSCLDPIFHARTFDEVQDEVVALYERLLGLDIYSSVRISLKAVPKPDFLLDRDADLIGSMDFDVDDDLAIQHMLASLPKKLLFMLRDDIRAAGTDISTAELMTIFRKTSRRFLASEPEFMYGQLEQADLVVDLVEKSAISAHAGTYVGTVTSSVNTTVALRNITGLGDTIRLESAHSMDYSRTFRMDYHLCLDANPATPFTVSLYKQDYDWKTSSSHAEEVYGLSTSIRTPSPFGRHTIAYDASLRNISSLTDQASLSVRSEAGYTAKSALRHEWVASSEDSETMPRHGARARMATEVAGLLGDVNHLRHETEVRASTTLPGDITLSIGAHAGFISPLFSKADIMNAPSSDDLTGAAKLPSNVPINDRFFLGGPLTMRGYAHRNFGPRIRRLSGLAKHGSHVAMPGSDAVGGDVFAAAAAHLYAPVPLVSRYADVRLHLFANAGSLLLRDPATPLLSKDTANALASSITTTTGLGLSWAQGPLRLECNLIFPTLTKGTSVEPGSLARFTSNRALQERFANGLNLAGLGLPAWQIGIGLSFF
ncbi:hypothetical protein H696_00819 [Fonticula alba]|uniref:Bacterial surface antigen (D15) domain-containing protein n=1 Tax=Fonticula alba TaxID=691883 RepID=A0A058ZID1_FONAL|nr:hypothetical protein H696_00819 [Fonticula alba]KCV73277.1 hypothetical protein H696_00819 [Fonticula alba]|eukprot:XP_009492978.1 hypothetical protein H696_00819 [Fonticula alba]